MHKDYHHHQHRCRHIFDIYFMYIQDRLSHMQGNFHFSKKKNKYIYENKTKCWIEGKMMKSTL